MPLLDIFPFGRVNDSDSLQTDDYTQSILVLVRYKIILIYLGNRLLIPDGPCSLQLAYGIQLIPTLSRVNTSIAMKLLTSNLKENLKRYVTTSRDRAQAVTCDTCLFKLSIRILTGIPYILIMISPVYIGLLSI